MIQQRQIKFRTWDPSTKKMFIPDVVTGDGGVYASGRDYENGINCNDCPTMQFTGLYDKNGKEIYEGDFIVSKHGDIMLVVWREDLASFALRKDGWMFDHYFGEAVNPKDCEVIGNVFSNPELVK